jgi:hypothetical protein
MFNSVADPEPHVFGIPDPFPLELWIRILIQNQIRVFISSCKISKINLAWIRIHISSCKISKKNLESYYLVIPFHFLSFKNDLNGNSKRNNHKIFFKNWVFACILKVNDESSRIRF